MKKNHTKEQLKALIEKGLTTKEIAETLVSGVSMKTRQENW